MKECLEAIYVDHDVAAILPTRYIVINGESCCVPN